MGRPQDPAFLDLDKYNLRDNDVHNPQQLAPNFAFVVQDCCLGIGRRWQKSVVRPLI